MPTAFERIKEHLENERHRINEEIKNYPPPIPACDAQFNYLLEERVTIGQELERLRALNREGLTRAVGHRSIEQFIESSPYINGEVEQRFRSYLLDVDDNKTVLDPH